jgi:RNA polymerase sigma-70 factor (ECF subfamily)
VSDHKNLIWKSKAAPGAGTPSPHSTPGVSLDFSVLYDAWFDRVSRWLGALGAPDTDREDLAQEVFLVVRRRLRDFDGRNVAGWLYRIASRKAGQHRRRRWISTLFSPRQTVDINDLPFGGQSAIARLETKEKQLLLDRLLSKMSERRRSVFVLFEVEGYAGEEIAEMLDVPVNTVWTRLHHARKDFYELLAQHRRTEREDA